MTEIIRPTRAKRGYIETKRIDNGGRIVSAKDNIVVSAGMHSTKEMEHIMREVADQIGAPEDSIRVEAFQNGEAPIEANPRHRGVGNMTTKSRKPSVIGHQERERVERPKESYQRRVWGGWSPPESS